MYKHTKFLKITAQGHIKPNFGRVSVVHGSIKWNEMNTLSWLGCLLLTMELYMSYTWYTGNQLWQQNISNLKKILIMDVFQKAKTELNEITLKRSRVGPYLRIYE